jgi:nucleolar protein 56
MIKTPFNMGEKVQKDPKKAIEAYLEGRGERDKNIIESGKKVFGSEDKFKSFLHSFCVLLAKKSIRESYSPDILTSHLINSSEETDKILNTFYERVSEIYGLYRPEKFKKLDLTKLMESIDKEKTGKEGDMGFELDKETLDLMKSYVKQMRGLLEVKGEINKRIGVLMNSFAKNLSAVLGETLGAKIISIAGSLQNLANMPSSTIQVLGAEKALFRHLRSGTKPPKHGVIIQHPLVAKAKREDKGRMARAVASKAAIAAKVDYYKGEFIGNKLLKELEERT